MCARVTQTCIYVDTRAHVYACTPPSHGGDGAGETPGDTWRQCRAAHTVTCHTQDSAEGCAGDKKPHCR